MNKIVLVGAFALTSIPAFANEFLGIFTTDAYPVDNCKITATKSMYVLETVGTYNQYVSKGKQTYLDEISDLEQRHTMHANAVKEGFNAIIGYRFNVHGGLVGHGGKVVNDSIGIGIYRTYSMGVPVKVVCE